MNPHQPSPPASADPIQLGYARPGTIHSLSPAELKAWLLTRRVVVLATSLGLGWWFARMQYLYDYRWGEAAFMLVLGWLVPLPRLSCSNARIRIRAEIRAAIQLICFIGAIAAGVALVMALLSTLPWTAK